MSCEPFPRGDDARILSALDQLAAAMTDTLEGVDTITRPMVVVTKTASGGLVVVHDGIRAGFVPRVLRAAIEKLEGPRN
jgi:hypothetical protein